MFFNIILIEKNVTIKTNNNKYLIFFITVPPIFLILYIYFCILRYMKEQLFIKYFLKNFH